MCTKMGEHGVLCKEGSDSRDWDLQNFELG